MRVLVTRAREDAERLAGVLAQSAIETVVEPLISITIAADAVPGLGGVQALLMTSANGVRAFAAKSTERRLPVLCVGDASGRAARDAGFTDVASAAGDVAALAQLVVRRLSPGGGALLHITQSHLAGDLAASLEASGFTYRRAVLYRAETAPALSPAARDLLAHGGLDGVLFFSPRTAQTFVSLARQANLEAACANLMAFCLSPAVAGTAGAIAWRSVYVADRPDQESLVACLVAAAEARQSRADSTDQ